MRPSYLGKILLRWCDACHVPVLSERCGCGMPTREVKVTPPGDARPAFPADIERINRIFEDHFGSPLIPPGHLVLLNKVPDPDRMEEVVLGGAVVGSIRYIPDERRWEPIPRPEAAVFMTPAKRFVVVDDGAVKSIQDEGASVLAPGLAEIDSAVAKGDEVFILDRKGECVGVGRAKVDAAAARQMDRGSIVRTRKNVRAPAVPGCATWEDAVVANREVIEEAEQLAVSFVSNVAARYDLPATVSYSGGKDSLATLLVVRKAIGDVPLIFVDTGLEFPETYENVDAAQKEYGLQVLRVSGEQAFWNTFNRQGPPAVDFRWCCRVCKLEPVRGLISDQWGECLSFIGQRKYESATRMKSERVWRNSRVKNQLSAAPIQHWTALHVWLYLFREKAPYNPLYAQGLDRIGCFMCPSSDLAVMEDIGERYPGLWQAWKDRLEAWRLSQNLPETWTTEGRWRMRGRVTDEEDYYY
jgi:phosphoadenosine phosphosulfate reductase